MNDYSAIPEELKALRRWVDFRFELRIKANGERMNAKIPYCPGGKPARSNDPSSWNNFDICVGAQGFDGVGFMLAPPYVGIDIDHVRNLTGDVSNFGLRIINRLDSYAEVSPSGHGIHIITKGTLPPGRRRTGSIEMYSSGRFFTMTGDHLAGTPTTINERTSEIAALHADIFPAEEHRAIEGNYLSGPDRCNHTAVLADDEVLRRASTAGSGARFRALWAGDWESLGYPSHSEGDSALCYMLAFWGCDESRIDSLFRQSGMMRDKWERESYRNRTLSLAVRATKHHI